MHYLISNAVHIASQNMLKLASYIEGCKFYTTFFLILQYRKQVKVF